ncbi:MAG TPA: type II toxin-antitoxin system RelE/ParE family toxin [Candidatus Rhabdochlamydia sp.]|nr:type II toxin-antitoxin system RelE/ParE family toxin [Candidatus Rhabdochlamydia sp.]
MIISFSDDETENIYNGVNTKKARQRLSQALWEKATTKLDMLNKAFRLEDLKIPPNNRLKKLSGNLAGKYSIRINDQYRIVFKWDADKREASEIKITDYH